MAFDPTVMIPDMDAITMEKFAPGAPFWDMMNRGTPRMDLIESSSEIQFFGKSEGKRLIFPAQFDDTANPAVPYPSTQRATGLPKAGKADLDQIIYQHVTHVQALEVEGDMIATVNGGDSSTIDGLTMQMRDQGIAARAEMNKVIGGDGSGAITGIVSAVDNVAHTITVPSTARLKVGTQFVVRGGLTGTRLDAPATLVCEVTNVTSATVFEFAYEDGTFATMGVPTGNDWVYRYDSQGAAVIGTQAFCMDSNPTNWGSATSYVGGIDRTVRALWQGYEHDAGGDLLDVQNDLQPMLDHLTLRGGDRVSGDGEGVIWYAFCGMQNHRVLESALTANVMTTPQSKIIKGKIGFIYEGAFFVKDKDGDPSEIQFVHGPSLYRQVLENWYWMNRTGAIWTMQKANDNRDADIYKAYMMTRQQMCACRCNTMGRIWNTNATL